jgi:hypothetical protein
MSRAQSAVQGVLLDRYEREQKRETGLGCKGSRTWSDHEFMTTLICETKLDDSIHRIEANAAANIRANAMTSHDAIRSFRRSAIHVRAVGSSSKNRTSTLVPSNRNVRTKNCIDVRK